MRRTRFRKRRQLWLPAYGTGGSVTEGLTSGLALGGQMELTNDGTEPGGIDWLASPLTFDTQIDPTDAQFNANPLTGALPIPLRDLVSGSEWSLRRVVGKCFTVVSEADGDATAQNFRAPAIEVGCGLIVCNTDEAGSPLTDFDEVNPLSNEAAEDPWIWMRHWLLGTFPASGVWTNYQANPLTRVGSQLPTNNSLYGSMSDGPHVDQKTARHIRRDQRLFFVMATRPNVLSDTDLGFNTADISVYVRYMFRFLGNIRSSSGNRGNASR